MCVGGGQAHTLCSGYDSPAPRSQVNPEIINFDDYFKTNYDDATYARMEKGTFFSAAFAQHWHNRYDWGIPERSWAGILFRRHQALLAKKVC